MAGRDNISLLKVMATLVTHNDAAPLESEALMQWIVEQGLQGISMSEVYEGFCTRLVAGGMQIQRGLCGMRVLHPLYEGFALIWHRGDDGVIDQSYFPADADPEQWARSPIKVMLEDGAQEIRRRILGPEAGEEFPVLEEFRQEGATDYFGAKFGYAIEAINPQNFGVLFTWTTDREGGFRDSELDFLRCVLPTLALTLRVAANRRFSQAVADAYLGHDAARRVLSGEIMRGHVETVSAVLVYCDLCGFTALGDRLGQSELVDLLNDYLSCMAEPVEARGGQVLKFMGDGMLATFALKEGAGARERGETAVAALDAALEALARVADLNRSRSGDGRPVMALNVALHLGEVAYGNVGSPMRLDFTVIGPAVNEVSRLESMCDPLERSLLISEAFAKAMPEDGPELLPLGRHGLRSVREPVRLFTVENVPE
jgi:adenylate cyclase